MAEILSAVTVIRRYPWNEGSGILFFGSLRLLLWPSIGPTQPVCKIKGRCCAHHAGMSVAVASGLGYGGTSSSHSSPSHRESWARLVGVPFGGAPSFTATIT